MPNVFLFRHGEARTARAITPNLRPDAEIVHPPVAKLFNLPFRAAAQFEQDLVQNEFSPTDPQAISGQERQAFAKGSRQPRYFPYYFANTFVNSDSAAGGLILVKERE